MKKKKTPEKESLKRFAGLLIDVSGTTVTNAGWREIIELTLYLNS